MKVEDTEQALTEAVCGRVREQLNGADAELAEAFARHLYRWVAPEDVAERDPLDLYGLALGHFNFARERTPGTPKVRVYNPRFEDHGWQSTHTAVEIVTDDMPFLIDSVSMELNRQECGVHLIIHPVMAVRRNAAGELVEIQPQTPGEDLEEGVTAESVIHAEVARQSDPGRLKEIEGHVLRVIGEVRAAVEDWPRDAERRARGGGGAARERRRSGGRGGRRVPRVARERPLHLPRLPRRRRARPGNPARAGPDRPHRRPHRGGRADHAHEGQHALHGPPGRVPRLRGRGRALPPRPLHAHRVPREPHRDPDPAPARGGRARARRVPAREPQREGAPRDPRHLPARRAVPDLGGRALRGGDGDPPPGRAPAAPAVRAPGPVPPLLLAARVRAARPLQHGEPAPDRGDPPDRHEREVDRLHDARVRVRARAAPLRGLREAGPDAGVRHARGRDDARGRDPLVVGRPRGGAPRGAGRGARRGALPPLRRRVPGGLPRRLGRALGARRHPAHRGAARERRPRDQPVPAARGRPADAPREAVPRRPRADALGRAAAVREHGRRGRRRAALPDRAARRRRRLDLRLRAHLLGRGRPRHGRRARELPGHVRARVARRRRERRLQPARAGRGAHVAGDHGAARDREVPPAGAHHLQRPLRGAGARLPPRDRAAAGGAVPGPLRPAPRRPRGRGRGGRPDRGGDRRGREPRPGPDPADVPRRDPRDAAHELLPLGPDGGGRASVLQARPLEPPLAAAAAAALRDLRLLAAHRGRPPARRRGRARRHPLVRPPRGLPHRGARPDEGPDGEERGDRARRRQGRLRGEAPAAGPRRPPRRGDRLLPDLHPRAPRPHGRHRGRRGHPARGRRAL